MIDWEIRDEGRGMKFHRRTHAKEANAALGKSELGR